MKLRRLILIIWEKVNLIKLYLVSLSVLMLVTSLTVIALLETVFMFDWSVILKIVIIAECVLTLIYGFIVMKQNVSLIKETYFGESRVIANSVKRYSLKPGSG